MNSWCMKNVERYALRSWLISSKLRLPNKGLPSLKSSFWLNDFESICKICLRPSCVGLILSCNIYKSINCFLPGFRKNYMLNCWTVNFGATVLCWIHNVCVASIFFWKQLIYTDQLRLPQYKIRFLLSSQSFGLIKCYFLFSLLSVISTKFQV